jgi:hypothetical protein
VDTKNLGVMLGGLAAVAGLAYVRSTMSGSLVESEDDEGDEDDDEGDDFEGALADYVRRARALAHFGHGEPDDLELIANESSLDMFHEFVKETSRRRHPMVMNLGTSSFNYNTYEGLPRALPIDWSNNPQLRWQVAVAAAMQARSMYDRLSRLPKSYAYSEVPGEEVGLQQIPDPRLLYAYATAMEQSATNALLEPGAKFSGAADQLKMIQRRGQALAQKHKREAELLGLQP